MTRVNLEWTVQREMVGAVERWTVRRPDGMRVASCNTRSAAKKAAHELLLSYPIVTESGESDAG